MSGEPQGPPKGIFCPKCPFWWPWRSLEGTEDQIWSLLSLAAPPVLDSWLSHTLDKYWASSVWYGMLFDFIVWFYAEFYFILLHCNVLHDISLYCIVFDIIAVYCMSPHCILWYGMVLYFIWSYCTALLLSFIRMCR